jgi:hypothetical protein
VVVAFAFSGGGNFGLRRHLAPVCQLRRPLRRWTQIDRGGSRGPGYYFAAAPDPLLGASWVSDRRCGVLSTQAHEGGNLK